MRKARQFFFNTVLLTATSLLMRSVGVTFQVYLSRKIGSTGIGLFQLVTSVYMLAVTLATSGIRLAVTRMVAEELGVGNEAGAKKSMAWCLLYSMFFGTGTAVLLFSFAPIIGVSWLGDERTILSLRILALSLPFLAMTSVVSGYFTAVRRVVKSAVTQVFEQLMKMTLTILGLSLFIPRELESACAIIVGGSTLGEMLSFVLLSVLYLTDPKRPGQRAKRGRTGAAIPRRMLGIALPVAVSAYARSGLSTVEHLLIPRGLKKSGISGENALTAYGTIHGMVMPVVLFPSALLYTVADLLVPELAECRAQNHTKRQNYIIGRVFKATFLFSIGVTGLLYSFSEDLGRCVYGSESVSYFIRIFAPLVPAMYLDASVDGMLKGLGEQMSSMRYNIVDSMTGIVLTVSLLPRLAINGYVITIFVTEILNFYLSARKLIAVTGYQLDLFSLVVKPLFCIVGAICVCRLFFEGTALWSSLKLEGGLLLSAEMGIVCGVYVLYLFLLRCITREDCRWFQSLFCPAVASQEARKGI